MQPNSELSINAVEGFPLEDFSIENVRSQIAEAQKIAGGSGSEQDIAEAKIELEVSDVQYQNTAWSNKVIGAGELASCFEIMVHAYDLVKHDKLIEERLCTSLFSKCIL